MLFVRDGIRSGVQKKALRKAGYIAYSHGFWHLSDLGKAEAVRRRFLD